MALLAEAWWAKLGTQPFALSCSSAGHAWRKVPHSARSLRSCFRYFLPRLISWCRCSRWPSSELQGVCGPKRLVPSKLTAKAALPLLDVCGLRICLVCIGLIYLKVYPDIGISLAGFPKFLYGVFTPYWGVGARPLLSSFLRSLLAREVLLRYDISGLEEGAGQGDAPRSARTVYALVRCCRKDNYDDSTELPGSVRG
jgi:hypothetical protein